MIENKPKGLLHDDHLGTRQRGLNLAVEEFGDVGRGTKEVNQLVDDLEPRSCVAHFRGRPQYNVHGLDALNLVCRTLDCRVKTQKRVLVLLVSTPSCYVGDSESCRLVQGRGDVKPNTFLISNRTEVIIMIGGAIVEVFNQVRKHTIGCVRKDTIVVLSSKNYPLV